MADDHELSDGLLERLAEWVAIPSVSADERLRDRVIEAGEWVASQLADWGFSVEAVPTPSGAPVVVAERRVARGPGGSRPRVLLYGHHDVHPVPDPKAWSAPPFSLTRSGEWLVGRGVADDKGPFGALLAAVGDLISTDQLGLDLCVVSDSEEEILGETVLRLIEGADLGEFDACLIVDGLMLGRDVPTFMLSSRGLVSVELRLSTAPSPLHSGFFGGVALNAAEALLSTIKEVTRAWQLETANPTRSGAVDRMLDLSRLPSGEDLMRAAGAMPAAPGISKRFFERTLIRPSLEVTAFAAGHADAVSAIPCEATATISARVAPGQDAEEEAHRLDRLLRSSAPSGADIEIAQGACIPSAALGWSPAHELVGTGFKEVFGRDVVVAGTGGSIPLLAGLSAAGIPTILTGLDLFEGNAHGTDERLLIAHLQRGRAATRAGLRNLSRLRGD